MPFLNFKRVDVLPTTLDPNTFYIQKGTESTAAEFHVVGSDASSSKHLFTHSEASDLIDSQVESLQNIRVVSNFSNLYGLPNGRNQVALVEDCLDDTRTMTNTLYKKGNINNKPFNLLQEVPVSIDSQFRVVALSEFTRETMTSTDFGVLYLRPSIDGTKLKATLARPDSIEPIEFEKQIARIDDAFASKKINIDGYVHSYNNQRYLMLYLTRPSESGALEICLCQFAIGANAVTEIPGITTWTQSISFNDTNYTPSPLSAVFRPHGTYGMLFGVLSLKKNNGEFFNASYKHNPFSVTDPVVMAETTPHAELRNITTENTSALTGYSTAYIDNDNQIIVHHTCFGVINDTPTIRVNSSGYYVDPSENPKITGVRVALFNTDTALIAVRIEKNYPGSEEKIVEIVILRAPTAISGPIEAHYLTTIDKSIDPDCSEFGAYFEFTTSSQIIRNLQIINYHETEARVILLSESTGWDVLSRYLTIPYYGGTPFDKEINTPSILNPVNNSINTDPYLQFESSAFSTDGVTDTHEYTDWEIASDLGFTNIVRSSYADTVNLTTYMPSMLDSGTVYYIRTRYKGMHYGLSDWSIPVQFTQDAAGFFTLMSDDTYNDPNLEISAFNYYIRTNRAAIKPDRYLSE